MLYPEMKLDQKFFLCTCYCYITLQSVIRCLYFHLCLKDKITEILKTTEINSKRLSKYCLNSKNCFTIVVFLQIFIYRSIKIELLELSILMES